jgi:hypothetical protein
MNLFRQSGRCGRAIGPAIIPGSATTRQSLRLPLGNLLRNYTFFISRSRLAVPKQIGCVGVSTAAIRAHEPSSYLVAASIALARARPAMRDWPGI